jgi:hypothetical protein
VGRSRSRDGIGDGGGTGPIGFTLTLGQGVNAGRLGAGVAALVGAPEGVVGAAAGVPSTGAAGVAASAAARMAEVSWDADTRAG